MRTSLATLGMIVVLAHPVAAQEAPSTVWDGAGWTAGMFAATNLTGTCEQTAELDANGVVRVTEDRCTTFLPMVQAHLLLPLSAAFSVGPAVGVALGEGVVQEAGVSVVVGLTAGDRVMTVGIGVWGQPDADVLQPQFVPGQPAPVGPDGVPIAPAYLRTTNIRTAVVFTIEVF